MTTNLQVFKAYDIRGVYGQDFDEELAYKLGLAFAIWRQRQLNRVNLTLVVGRDMRLSSANLHAELIRGLTDGGAKVIDIGLAATPTFYFAVAHYGYDGGIIVSASHNPSEYNGFKMVKERAKPVGEGTGMEELKDMVMDANLQPGSVKGKVDKQVVIKDQIKYDLTYVKKAELKPLKLVIDPANGMGAHYFDELLLNLDVRAKKINWQLDGSFPNHEADPYKVENLRQLGEAVRQEGADLGIATDGDGDRIFFVDEQGEPVEAGIARALLCEIFLAEKPGAKIAYDIRPGKITEDVIIKNGGQPIVTRVGHSLIKAKTVQEGAYFAGESSGHFFLNMEEGCYEVPMIIALKIIKRLSQTDKPMSQVVKPYQQYFHSGEINSKVEDKEAVMQQLKEKYADSQLSEQDGISIEYQDWWFNVRPSNTEPLLRLNLEARSQELMEEKRDEVLAIIRG